MTSVLKINRNIRIPDSELEESFVRASGPGGQHVNTASTAVQLRFNVAASPSLPDAVAQRLLRQAAGHVNRDGVLIIEAKRYRSQQRNRADARRRLARWIERAAHPPKPRKATRPSRAAQRRRLQSKKHRAGKKAARRPPGIEDG